MLHSVAGLKDRLRETTEVKRQLQVQLQEAKAFKAKFYFLQQVSVNREKELEEEAERDEADTVLALLALADGKTARGLGLARVSRRLLEGGRGPLTPGMGACAPPPGIPPPVTA